MMGIDNASAQTIDGRGKLGEIAISAIPDQTKTVGTQFALVGSDCLRRGRRRGRRSLARRQGNYGIIQN
ncbi:MAG: hypothetical protein L0Y71_07680 [Gemmataceae bacterium]|nr:hypothetical protein [Gemmataceae bacterium]